MPHLDHDLLLLGIDVDEYHGLDFARYELQPPARLVQTPRVFAGFQLLQDSLQVSRLLFHSVMKAPETVEDPVQTLLQG